MEVYLDNSATTKTDENVIEVMTDVMRKDFGNPSSKHRKGFEAEQYLREARNSLSGILKVSEKEIIFTSGGTEANNLAILGGAFAGQRKGRHLITTCVEHPSVSEPMKFLEKFVFPDGGSFEITYLPVNKEGLISLKDLKEALRPDTVLVSVMFANNEIGSVQDISSIGRIVKECAPGCLFHVDAVQAFGKFPIFPRKMQIDLLSVSAHKFHGPKGVGFLYKNEKTRLNPLILGGGQQKGMRSGTDNVPGIAGMSEAAKQAYRNLPETTAHLAFLKNKLTEGLEKMAESCPGENAYIKINSHKGEAGAPHIVSATFYPVKSEVMLHALEEQGIFVSSGSACSSNKPGVSRTLSCIGLSPKEADSTIRFSFCKYNTEEEVDYTLSCLRKNFEILQKYVAR